MLMAGVSISDISPEEGIELAGYPHFLRHNTGIHDPLFASCILLNDGMIKIAMICMDILFFSKKYVTEIRKRAAESIDIKPENIVISCSHTHSGPWASGRLDLEALEKGLKPDTSYVEKLKNKLIELIISADKNCFKAKIGTGFGICGEECGIGGNRRNPEGPTDPQVWTIGVKDMNDNWKAILIKYSLHPTVIHEYSTVVTADYPAYVRKYISISKPGAILLFAQGTSGDQSSRYFRQNQNFEEAERIGSLIGKTADKTLSGIKYTSEINLAVFTKEIDIELRTLPSESEAIEKVKKARKKLTELEEKKSPYIEIQNANLKNLGAECTLGYVRLKNMGKPIELETDELPVEIKVICIGDTRIVTMQGEIFVELGLEIKEKSPFKKTFVISLSNGVLPGYACTQQSIIEGGYEVDTSLLTDGAGKKMINAALDLLEESRNVIRREI